MPPIVATAVFALGIAGLFALVRDRKIRPSGAVWVPVVWLLIAGSRSVSLWLQMGPPSSSDEYLEGSPLDRNLLTALLILGVIVIFRRRERVSRLLLANSPLLCFFLYCALSILWSDFPDVAFKRWTKALGDLVMILVIVTDRDPMAAVKRFFERAAFLLLPISVLLIKYYPDIGRAYNRWTWTPSWTGVTTDKNMLGMITMVLGIASVWRFVNLYLDPDRSRNRNPMIAHGVILLTTVWLLHEADSATSLSCFCLASGLMLITSLSSFGRKPSLVHLLVAFEVSLSVYALFFNTGGELVQGLGRNSTLSGRTELWTLILGMVKNPLFGFGYESFWLGPRLEKIWGIYWFHPSEAHDAYLEIYLDLGWIGLALVGFMMAWGYHKIFGAFRRDPARNCIRLAFFVVMAIYSLTEHAFREMNPVWIMFLFAIVGIPGKRAGSRQQSARDEVEHEPVLAAVGAGSEGSVSSQLATPFDPIETHGLRLPGSRRSPARTDLRSTDVLVNNTVLSGSDGAHNPAL